MSSRAQLLPVALPASMAALYKYHSRRRRQRSPCDREVDQEEWWKLTQQRVASRGSHMDPFPLPLPTVAIGVASLLLLFIIPKLLSLLFSKPGSRLPLPPGPRGWPVLGSLPHLGAKPHQTLCAMARAYGPLFHLRLGSVHVVVAASPAMASLFLKTHDANFCNRPPNTGAWYMAYGYQDLVWASYGPLWRTLRKICTHHLFSPKALDDSAAVRREEVAVLAGSLSAAGRAGRVVEVGDLLTVYTANILTRAMLGRRMFVAGGAKGDEEARQFKELTVELNTLAGVFMVGDFVPWLRWMNTRGETVARMRRVAERYDELLDRVIEQHLASERPSLQGDMLRVLIGLKEDAGGEGVQLTDTTIKALLLDLFNAGTDTSSSTVEWTLAELVRHPEILEAAQRELDSVAGQGRLVAEADLPRCPLVQAIVKETMRLHPPTPLSIPHLAAEACDVGGYHVPKGATLLVNVWAIGRDPDVWADPLEFRPSRFLPGGEHAHVDVRGNHFEVIPFGAGRRICAGMSLALRVIQLATATLIQGFDWAMPAGQALEKLDMEEAYGLTLQRAVPLRLRPVPRLPLHAYGVAAG